MSRFCYIGTITERGRDKWETGSVKVLLHWDNNRERKRQMQKQRQKREWERELFFFHHRPLSFWSWNNVIPMSNAFTWKWAATVLQVNLIEETFLGLVYTSAAEPVFCPLLVTLVATVPVARPEGSGQYRILPTSKATLRSGNVHTTTGQVKPTVIML